MSNILTAGKTYKMSGFGVVCIKQRKNGSYKMQTLGMTAGPWPGEGDISNYDDVTKTFTQMWAEVIDKFSLPKRTRKIATYRGKTYKALIKAARNNNSFGASEYSAWLGGASERGAWLGTAHGSNFVWHVYSNGFVNLNNNRNDSFVVAPSFLLNPSKIILDGDEIKRKPEETASSDAKSDTADIVVQFARLWGQHEAYTNSAADEDLSDELKQYDSVELLELLTKWAKEYMESDIENTCEFFETKLKKLSELEVAA